MKKIFSGLRKAVMTYLAWGWPLLLADVCLEMWAGESSASWRSMLNGAAFAWIVCAPLVPLSLLVDRNRREAAMARLCGLREGDERERVVTGEAARSTLLLALSLQVILLVLCVVNVHLVWNPNAAKKNERGILTVGLSFSDSRHFDPFGGPLQDQSDLKTFGANSIPPAPGVLDFGGFVLSPSLFSILALLILIQIAAFKAYSVRRYDGTGL